MNEYETLTINCEDINVMDELHKRDAEKCGAAKGRVKRESQLFKLVNIFVRSM